MSGEQAVPDPLGEALLAARLLGVARHSLGGICLRGGGPARDLVLEALREGQKEDRPWRRMPGHVDDERLLGGIDVAASLAVGRPVERAGLLAEVAGGMLVVPMAERLREAVAGRLAQAIDAAQEDSAFGLVLCDDGHGDDERSPAALLDRVAFVCDLSAVRSLDVECPDGDLCIALDTVAPAPDEALTRLAATAEALGIETVRPLLFALAAARAHAAHSGRREIESPDLEVAARLVLAPRATRLPPEPAPRQDDRQPESEETNREGEEAQELAEQPSIPEDLVLAAALAAIPRDLLERIAEGRSVRSAAGGGSGRRTRSLLRGKPLGAVRGLPRGGARLALIDTLRAAVPWQEVRRREEGGAGISRIHVRKGDLRVRRFEERAGTVTVFCVDASGSAAMSRLAEAKGAVELILAQAYVKRCEVALIAFRGTSAELLLPPTRSLTRARRALAGLPGGGGTPLASGLSLVRDLSGAIAARGRVPFAVILTDGSANICADGTPGRAQAREDALTAARAMAAGGLEGLVIDISARPRPEASQLAEAARAGYLPLPMADAQALQGAVTRARAEAVGA